MTRNDKQPGENGELTTSFDFPVTWEDPDDENLYWETDRAHFPGQMSPFTASAIFECVEPAWAGTMNYYELPFHPKSIYVNTFFYSAMAPVTGSVSELSARAKRSKEKLEIVLFQLRELWDTEWLPETKQNLDRLEGFNTSAADIASLSTHLEDTLERCRRLFEIHYRLFIPMTICMDMYDDLYRELFGPENPFESYRLLQGFDNKSLQADRALWQLSRQAIASATVKNIIESVNAGEVIDELEKTTAGKAFLSGFSDFLRAYGWRSDKFGFDYPCWLEDPATPIANLKVFITQPDRDWLGELSDLSEERERLVSRDMERLSGYPGPVRSKFEAMLKAAQEATVLTEDHSYYLDNGTSYFVRRVCLEVGRRFASAGLINAPGDIFYLSLHEIRETLSSFPEMRRHDLVATRRVEQERFQNVKPPAYLGTLPVGDGQNGFRQLSGKFFGTSQDGETTASVIKGSPGSPGKVRGPVKVVRALSEAGKVRKGDILVAETMLPSWTPLFATVAGVVTDTGGVLSHCAVVAREYRIPAVVATGDATLKLIDGQMVEVDGNAGKVQVLRHDSG